MISDGRQLPIIIPPSSCAPGYWPRTKAQQHNHSPFTIHHHHGGKSAASGKVMQCSTQTNNWCWCWAFGKGSVWGTMGGGRGFASIQSAQLFGLPLAMSFSCPCRIRPSFPLPRGQQGFGICSVHRFGLGASRRVGRRRGRVANWGFRTAHARLIRPKIFPNPV